MSKQMYTIAYASACRVKKEEKANSPVVVTTCDVAPTAGAEAAAFCLSMVQSKV